MRRTLKMSLSEGNPIPFWLESKLVNDYGYYIQKRFPGEYILFVKMSNTTASSNNPKSVIKPDVSMQPAIKTDVPSLGRALTNGEKQLLEERCDRIVDFFMDPYTMIHPVRARLNNMRQTLKSVEEQQFVLDFMEEHFSLEDKKL